MFSRTRRVVWLTLGLLLFAAPVSFAQKQLKAEKIINDYFKASGGKKQLAAIKHAVYEWRAIGSQTAFLRTQIQAPGSWRFDIGSEEILDSASETTMATNGSAVWRRDVAQGLQTLTDAESKALRLQAVLAATRLIDWQKQRVSAQIVGKETIADETAYIVEFTARNGAKVRYFFGANSRLPLKIETPALKSSFCFADYRQENKVLEPHRLINNCGTAEAQTFELVKVSFNTNQNLAVFDPPRTLENFDVAELLKELQKNEQELQSRLNQYSFLQTSIEREFDNKGTIKKETRKVYEVFPTRLGRAVLKLVSENGVALTGEKLSKEEQRTAKELVEADEDYEKELQKREKRRLEKQGGRGDNAPDEAQLERNTIATLLKISELYSPRIEFFRDRETIVVNFRPRADFKPSNLAENIFSKLAGTAWIDQKDKQIIRAEARVVDNISFGGFLAKFRKDSALVFERTKFDNEIWLPKLFQANASARFLFASFDAAVDNEYGNYKKYSTETKDYKVNSPNQAEQKP